MLYIVTFKSGTRQKIDIDDGDPCDIRNEMRRGAEFWFSDTGVLLRLSEVAGLAPDYDSNPEE